MTKPEITVHYRELIRKLDRFIRKYYKNLLLRGLILFAAIALVTFLAVITIEYFSHLGPLARTILFYLYIIANLAVFIMYIAIPLLKIRKIGKIISYDQAARIVGRHFHEVGDKLLNTLQLNRLYESGNEETALLEASIQQKTKQLNPIPFSSAISFKKNRKFLRYVFPPLVLLLLLVFISPTFITRPTNRIIHHSQVFAEPAPFRFVIANDKLETFQQEDFTLKVRTEGEIAPEEIYLVIDNVRYKMQKENTIRFYYVLKALQKSLVFRLESGNYHSVDYELKVFPRPLILNFDVELDYPLYLNRKKEILENTGDLIIPEGTKTTWRFYTRDVSGIKVRMDDEANRLPEKKGNEFEFTYLFEKSLRYSISAFNAFSARPDSLSFSVTVIPDAYPVITVEESQDSSMPSYRFYRGIIKDDYGFSRLEFTYSLFENGDTNKKEIKSIDLPFDKTVNQQSFFYSFDPTRLITNPGDAVEFYFEVCDNDAIHGKKCSRTGLFHLKAPTEEEIEKITQQSQQNISDNIESVIKETQSLQQQMDDMNRRLVDKNTLTWQDRKQIQDLLDRQKNLQDQVDKIRKQDEQKNQLEEQYNRVDSSIMQKQKQLNELFNQVMDDDMKKLVQELKDMLDKIDKSQVQQMLEKMKMNNKDIEQQLDRTLDLFKQLEFEKNLSETIDKLKKLSEDQKQLGQKTENKSEENNRLIEEQKKINDQYDELKKNMDNLEQKNRELPTPGNFPDTRKQQESITNDLNNSMNSLQDNKQKDAAKSQNSASGKMNELAQKLENMQNSMESDQMSEDVGQLRQILEDLVRISFDQEDLMNSTKVVNRNDPRYLALIQQQNDLKEDLGVVEDSLYQLARRQVMIKPYIMREISSINRNVEEAVDNMNSRNTTTASAKQQYVMTSVNNLALLLSEVLKEMESQLNSMMSQKQGNSSCNKGGSGGKNMSMRTIREMQEQLNQQLQQLKKQMESMKLGQQEINKSGDQTISEQLARLAAQQEAIRNEMRKYADQLNEQGKTDNSNLNDAMVKMEQTEKDLVNRRILQETLNRQQQILTRLLESEKAEQKRNQEEKRESTEAKNPKISNPSGDFQYNIIKSQTSDLLRKIQAPYNYFYKNKINSYLLQFGR